MYTSDAPRYDCGNWYASHDHMPPGPRTLQVRGECTFPTGGYSATLRRREPQGINPTDLLLELVVEVPIDIVTQVIATVPVEYREETDVEYETVTILPDITSLPVEHVE